jgi:hypothetical protein
MLYIAAEHRKIRIVIDYENIAEKGQRRRHLGNHIDNMIFLIIT